MAAVDDRRRHFPRRPRALALLAGGLVAALVPVQGASAAPASTADTAAALDHARQMRVAAERRVAQLDAEAAAAKADLDQKFAGSAQLTAQLARARSEMRESAIRAYVQGGVASDDRTLQFLAGTDPAEMSGRSVYLTHRTADWSEAAQKYRALKSDHDPQLVAATARTEELSARLAEARDAAMQAAANESDAERAHWLASEEAQRAAAAEAARRAVAEQAAREQALAASAAHRAAAPAAAPRPAASSAGSRPAAPIVPPLPSGAVVPLADLSAPLPVLPPGGPSPEQWAALRRCESGGNYRAVSSSGRYRGAYQFDRGTWAAQGGVGDPAAALPMEQDARARALWFQRGSRPWPHCGKHLG